MYKLKLKHHFDSSHKLELDYKSPCQNTHGHRWEVIITITTYKLNKNGMVVDFKHLKEIVNELDHKCLNEELDFNPTAENISKYLYEKISKLGELYNVKVEIYESPEASITYSI